MSCRQFVLLQFLVSSTANLFGPTEANSCQLINVPPPQLDCIPSTNVVMVQCSARCSQTCGTFSINWFWGSSSKFGVQKQLSSGVYDHCADGVYRSSTLSINLDNVSYGGYYWCEVPSADSSLRSPSMLINPSCDYRKPLCSEIHILTNLYNSSAFPAVVTNSCQPLPKSAFSPLSISSSPTCANNGCPTSNSPYNMLSTISLTSVVEASLSTTMRETAFEIPIAAPLSSGIALSTATQALTTTYSYSPFPTNLPYSVVSFNTMMLVTIAAALVVVSVASALLTVSVCICWRCKAKSPIAEQTEPPLRGLITQQNSLNSTASSTNALETNVSGLSATPQNADGGFYSSVVSVVQNSNSVQWGYPRTNSSDPLEVSMARDHYNKLNHPQKADAIFQRTAHTTLTPRSNTSDYSLLQENRYQSTSLLGSQSDQRYNHVNRATPLNALTISAPMVPDGDGNQMYGHLTFDSDRGEHSNSAVLGNGRAWNVADPCPMGESSLTVDGSALANCTSQSIGQTQYRTALNPRYELAGQSEVCKSKKIDSVDAGQSEPMGCGPIELERHYPTGPVWYQLYEQVSPITVAPTGVNSHNALSEKQSTTEDDVPLVKSASSPTEESKKFGQDLLLAQRAHLGASDHVYHVLEQQGRYQ